MFPSGFRLLAHARCAVSASCAPSDGRACCADDADVLSAVDLNADEGMSPEETADVTVLRARVKHLEMQQSLMDGELESMSDLAKQTDTQLRCSPNLATPAAIEQFLGYNALETPCTGSVHACAALKLWHRPRPVFADSTGASGLRWLRGLGTIYPKLVTSYPHHDGPRKRCQPGP